VTCDGRLFHRRAAATGNALSPTVDRRVRRTSRDVDEAERSRRLPSVSEVALPKSSRESISGTTIVKNSTAIPLVGNWLSNIWRMTAKNSKSDTDINAHGDESPDNL